MSERRGDIVYQQRFTSTEPVTDALNEFLKIPQRGFTLYAKKEYTPKFLMKTDSESKEIDRKTAERITDIQNHSLRLGTLGLQLGPSIGAIAHKRGVELDFTPFAATAYWNIMQKFFEDQRTPDDEALQHLALHAIYVNLPRTQLKSSAGFKMAANNLTQTLKDPATSYQMEVTKLKGASEAHRVRPLPQDDRDVV